MWRQLWELWKIVAAKIGNLQARLILTALYFLLVGPIALLRRLAADPLGRRRAAGPTYWTPRDTPDATLDAARRQ